jgi:hypothetical protein
MAICGGETRPDVANEHKPKELTNMTALQQTTDVAAGRRTATLNPLAAVALGVAVVGGIVGGVATAAAAQTVFDDTAAEQARLTQFAEQYKYALRWDDLNRQLHPYVDE